MNIDNDSGSEGLQPSPYELKPPSSMSEDTTFVLPDAECFQVLAGMAGQIRLADQTGSDSINVSDAFQQISANMEVAYNGFRTENLAQASEGIGQVVFNALVIAGVCEAHAPGVFSGLLDNTYQRMPFPPDA